MHFGVLGQSQTGKSTLLARMAQGLPPQAPVLILDPANSRAFDPVARPMRAPDRVLAGPVRIIPPLDAEGHVIGPLVGRLLRMYYRAGNATVIADEVADWPWLEALARRGMQRGLGVWWASQYAVGAPRYLLSQSLVLMSGFQGRQTDIRMLEDATSVSWNLLPRLGPHDMAAYVRGERSVRWPSHLRPGARQERVMRPVRNFDGDGTGPRPGDSAGEPGGVFVPGSPRDGRGRFLPRAPSQDSGDGTGPLRAHADRPGRA